MGFLLNLGYHAGVASVLAALCGFGLAGHGDPSRLASSRAKPVQARGSSLTTSTRRSSIRHQDIVYIRDLKEIRMAIKPIETEDAYRATLSEIESLMRAEPDTPEGERLDALVTLVEVYERQHFPMDLPIPWRRSSS